MSQKSTSALPILAVVAAGAAILGIAFVVLTEAPAAGPQSFEPTRTNGTRSGDADEQPSFESQIEDESDAPISAVKSEVKDDPKPVRVLNSSKKASRESALPGDRLQGQVVDSETGAPVTYFRIYAVLEEEATMDIRDFARRHPTRGRAVRHAKGQFNLGSLSGGTYTVLVDAPKFEQTVLDGVTVPSGASLTIRMGLGANIRGRVIDAMGRQVAGIKVFIRRTQAFDNRPPPRVRISETDRNGNYIFTKLPDGLYTLTIGNDKDHATEAISVTGEARVDRDLTLPIDNTLNVTVVDGTGRTLNHARIRAWSKGSHRTATTDLSGRAMIRYLPAGKYSLKISCRGFRTKNETVYVRDFGQQDLQVIMESSSH